MRIPTTSEWPGHNAQLKIEIAPPQPLQIISKFSEFSVKYFDVAGSLFSLRFKEFIRSFTDLN